MLLKAILALKLLHFPKRIRHFSHFHRKKHDHRVTWTQFNQKKKKKNLDRYFRGLILEKKKILHRGPVSP